MPCTVAARQERFSTNTEFSYTASFHESTFCVPSCAACHSPQALAGLRSNSHIMTHQQYCSYVHSGQSATFPEMSYTSAMFAVSLDGLTSLLLAMSSTSSYQSVKVFLRFGCGLRGASSPSVDNSASMSAGSDQKRCPLHFPLAEAWRWPCSHLHLHP